MKFKVTTSKSDPAYEFLPGFGSMCIL